MLFLISLTHVSAADNQMEDFVTMESDSVSDETLSVENEEIGNSLESNDVSDETSSVENEENALGNGIADEENTIRATSENGNFGDLYNDIETSTDILIFNRNYTRNGNENPQGIAINKNNFVIDGQGYTIDGRGNGRIFQIGGNNITLKNINFINGKYSTVGGAIYSVTTLYK